MAGSILNYLDIVWVLMLGLFIFSKKKYIYPEKSISKAAKIFFGFFAGISLFIVIFMLTVIYYNAYNPDYEYDIVNNKVEFHIYVPNYIPTLASEQSKFFLSDANPLAGNSEMVRQTYMTSLKNISSKDNPVITVDQGKVRSNFDIKTFVNNLKKEHTKNGSVIQELTNEAFNNNMYLVEHPNNSLGVIELYCSSEDGVLIALTAVRTDKQELIKMANSLE